MMRATTSLAISAVVATAITSPTTASNGAYYRRHPRVSYAGIHPSTHRTGNVVVASAYCPASASPRPIFGGLLCRPLGARRLGMKTTTMNEYEYYECNQRSGHIRRWRRGRGNRRLHGDGMMHPSTSSFSSSSARRSGGMMTRAATQDDDDGIIDHGNDIDDRVVAVVIPKLNLERKTWMFRGVYPISYEVASVVDDDEVEDGVDVVPILLLNGFGVGTFHQHRLMRQLLVLAGADETTMSSSSSSSSSSSRRRYSIYGVDYLGQGSSWPSNCDDGNADDERDLAYSADTWLEQVGGFLEDVVVASTTTGGGKDGGGTVHLVGNSVGGYLATMIAHRYPHLISSLTLLNATPVWGLNLPGWDGRLPPPPFPRWVGRVLFDVIRNDDVIEWYLETAYVHGSAFDGTYRDGFDDDMTTEAGAIAGSTLGDKIRACTEVSNGGHAAFASILWSPPASEVRRTTTTAADGFPDVDDNPPLPTTAVDYYRTLGELEVDVLLLFGADDPWCTPAIAKRMHATLYPESLGESKMRPPARRYVSLDNVGHCPNHESPTAVARVLLRWIGASPSSTKADDGVEDDDDDRRSGDGGRRDVSLVCGDVERVHEPWGVVGMREVAIDESRNLAVMDRIISSLVG